MYDTSGHKFVSRLSVDMSHQNTEMTITLLRDLMAGKVCTRDLCTVGLVRFLKCELLGMVQKCEFSIAYEAISQIADERCNEECVRDVMVTRLIKAENSLEMELMSMSEDPRSRLKADMKTFDTRRLITCHAGYHLIEDHHKRCFPCAPGSFSGLNLITPKCHMCDVGQYQEHYGRHSCEPCEEGKTTDTVGSKSRDECVIPKVCNCGGNGSCSFTNGNKNCMCALGFSVENGKCKECDCGINGICVYTVNGEKLCYCDKGFISTEDKCKECDCGDNGFCYFDHCGKKACSCRDGHIVKDEKCEECIPSRLLTTSIVCLLSLIVQMSAKVLGLSRNWSQTLTVIACGPGYAIMLLPPVRELTCIMSSDFLACILGAISAYLACRMAAAWKVTEANNVPRPASEQQPRSKKKSVRFQTA